MSHKISWNGEILSLKKICKKEDISENAVYKRISLTGEDPKTVLLYYLNQPNKGNKGSREKLVLNGEYLDIKNYCKKLGVNYNAVLYYKELHPKMEYIDIISTLKDGGGGIREKIELNGKFLSVKKYCDQLNYDYRLVTRYKKSQPNKSYMEVLKERETLTEDEILNNIHLFDIWTGMLGRCENPKHPNYIHYGGKKPKPVTVCKEWHDYMTFRNQVWNDYIKHVEQYGREQTTIDRKKSYYNYSLKECEWKDWEGQGRNKSNTKYILPCNNYQKTLLQHCNKNGYNYETIRYYIKKYNLTPDNALAKYLKEIKNE